MYKDCKGPTNLSSSKFPDFDETSFFLPLYSLELDITLYDERHFRGLKREAVKAFQAEGDLIKNGLG